MQKYTIYPFQTHLNSPTLQKLSISKVDKKNLHINIYYIILYFCRPKNLYKQINTTMKISFNWLKQYLNFDLNPEETGKLLTNCGLEVENIELFETIKGGLKGLVVGEVLTCEDHPDSDHLHVTTVNVGGEKILDIVCGAPNVAAGQKVIVATIGTVLYDEDKPFTIKKSKIRGCVSEGMICAEDEIGVGTAHEGIMVLPADAQVGTPAAEYFKIEADYVFEIGLTPNRSDAISHLGVARDLFAMLKMNDIHTSQVMTPAPENFISAPKNNKIDIVVENKTACPRYTGMCLENVEVKESPAWLQNRLRSIGIRPVNNIVDITQFVMFECGQPLHAFDSDRIKGNKVIVKNLPTGTPFTTLDGNEIKLDEEDLMICNQEEGMCIAGVYGGLDSGITQNTQNVFLESAYFQATSIRKTSKRHNLKTDAAFRYERGCNPDITVYAIKRAANLMIELANATVASEIIDVYPNIIERNNIVLNFDHVYKVIGKVIDKDIICNILQNLGFKFVNCTNEFVVVDVPLDRVDVLRPIDLIEEILRIYGYNNVEIPTTIKYTTNSIPENRSAKLQKRISIYLANSGLVEIMNNSLTKDSYATTFPFLNENETIQLLNPLSSELNAMRQALFLGGLETIARNLNNRNNNLRLFEFGKVYYRNSAADNSADVATRFLENQMLSFWFTGKNHDEIWNSTSQDMDFYTLKNVINNLLAFLNIPMKEITVKPSESTIFSQGIEYLLPSGELLFSLGIVSPKTLKAFDIKREVYYAETNMEVILKLQNSNVLYTPIPVFPTVKRDLALVVDKSTTYQTLEAIAFKFGGNRLKSVSLFDVYEGDKLEAGKKSYALNFVLHHPEKTLTEEEINKVMNKLIAAFERECNAKLR